MIAKAKRLALASLTGVTLIALTVQGAEKPPQAEAMIEKERRVSRLRDRILISSILYVDSMNTAASQFKELLKQKTEDQAALRDAVVDIGASMATLGIINRGAFLLKQIKGDASGIKGAVIAILKATQSKSAEKGLEDASKRTADYLKSQLKIVGEASAIDIFFNDMKDLAMQERLALLSNLYDMSPEELASTEADYDNKQIKLSHYLSQAWGMVERYKMQVLPLSVEEEPFFNPFIWIKAIKAFKFNDAGVPKVGLVEFYHNHPYREDGKVLAVREAKHCKFLGWVDDEFLGAAKFKMQKIYGETELNFFSLNTKHFLKKGLLGSITLECSQLEDKPSGLNIK